MDSEVPPIFNMLLLLSRFSRVRLCATPETAAHQAPPSLGFSMLIVPLFFLSMLFKTGSLEQSQ